MAEGFAQAFRVNPVNSLFVSPAGEVSRAVYTYKSIGKKLVPPPPLLHRFPATDRSSGRRLCATKENCVLL